MTGIYKITCKPNSKVYIGQSVDIKERWKDHIRRLKNNKHDNQHLQNAFNKYGIEAFTFEVIEECERNFDVLNKLEVKYIAKYDALNRKVGFNIATGGGNAYSLAGKTPEEIREICIRGAKTRSENWKKHGHPRKGTHISEEQKAHLSAVNTGKLNPWYGKKRPEQSEKMMGDKNPRAKAVICLNTLEVFECGKFAGAKYNTTNSNILKACRGTQRYAGKDAKGNKLRWMYYSEYVKEGGNDNE